MNKLFAIAVCVAFYAALLPAQADAYLMPLVGVGGVLLTMFIGVLAALCAALFLLFYNLRRLMRRWSGKSSSAHTHMQPPPES
jgi:hypothetical protein